MRTLILQAISCVFVLCQTGFAVQLPDPRIVQYAIHEDPTDPNSDIRFTITMEIAPADWDGDSVGWEIEYAEFRQYRTDSSEAVWEIEYPFVDTVDGLWWVDHIDKMVPRDWEFGMLPQMVGTAAALNTECDDLDFDVEAGAYSEPPEGPPFAMTTALTYRLIADSPNDPVDDGDDDEPVDIPDPTNGPKLME